MQGGDVESFQVALNHRFERWEIGLRVKTDGQYGAATRQAARRVARGLGIAPEDLEHGVTPAVRVLIRNPGRRTAAQLERARANAVWLKALRKRYPVDASHRERGTSTHGSRPEPHPASGLEAAIRAHGGRYEDVIVREAHAQSVPVSLVCAVLQMESGFRNVFGHDKVANPVRSPAGGLLEVTEERYRTYLKHRKAGQGAQGVGPAQLTWPAFQDRADKLGGCWKPGPNIKVAVGVLADNIKAAGIRGGIASYNGSGSAAQAYAGRVLALERTWRKRLAGASGSASSNARARPGGGGGASRHPAAPHQPRVYRLTAQPMSGSDIQAFQDALNERMQRWGVDLQIEEDGVYGPTTRVMARRVLRGLGIASSAYEHGITPELRSVIRNPSKRTPQQLAQARKNRRGCGRCASATRWRMGPAARGTATTRSASAGSSSARRTPVRTRWATGSPTTLSTSACPLVTDARARRRRGHEGSPSPAGRRALRWRPDHDPRRSRQRVLLRARRRGRVAQASGCVAASRSGRRAAPTASPTCTSGS